MDRRTILKTPGLAVAGSALLPLPSFAKSTNSIVESSESDKQQTSSPGKRKLGASLEVSSVGLGVQNMSRTYQTMIPSRPEMRNIIRTAFDKGVTFLDAAEAYKIKIVGERLPAGVLALSGVEAPTKK